MLILGNMGLYHMGRQVLSTRFRSPKAMNIFRYYSKKGSMIDFSEGTDVKLISSGQQGTIIKASKGWYTVLLIDQDSGESNVSIYSIFFLF